MSYLFLTVLVLVTFAAGAFFWAWSAIPRKRVPPHFVGDDLKRLETEDRLRQTSYQILAGVALVFTFLLTVYQAIMSYNQWSSDHFLRIRQAEVTHLSEALKALTLPGDGAARSAGYFSLRQLVKQYPEEGEMATNVLAATVRAVANEHDPFKKAGFSKECSRLDGPTWDRDAREDAHPDIETPLKILGDKILADVRSNTFDGRACVARDGKASSLGSMNLSHQALNNLDLNGANLSCLDMSQSKFFRTNFRYANLRGTDFRGATFDDWQTSGFNETIDKQEPAKGTIDRAVWLHDKEAAWRRYRCWIADLRGANLTGARFEGAGLAGVDFTGAVLSEARFDDANVSRANFRGVTGLQAEQLAQACADDPPLFDDKAGIAVKTCK